MHPTGPKHELRCSRGCLAAGVLLALALVFSSGQTAWSQGSQTLPPSSFSPVPGAQTNLVPMTAPPAYAPPSGFGSFDPYAASPGVGSVPSSIGPPVGIGGPQSFGSPAFGSPAFGSPTTTLPPNLSGGLASQPASAPFQASPFAAPGNFGSPAFGSPAFGGSPAAGFGAPLTPYNNPNVYGPPPNNYGISTGNVYPDSIYPQSSPSTLFPSGLAPAGFGSGFGQLSVYDVFRGPRFRQSYLGFGDSEDDLNVLNTDVSTIFAVENFLFSNQPLQIIPSFSLHLWDGPKSSSGADLPGSAYSAFVDLGWNSDPNQMFSTEFGVRVGVFSEFGVYSGDSIRVLGKGLASFRLTPNSTLKGGVYYLDRVDWKLLPAVGLLWQPNPITRMDIFFPQPKFARYCRTVGTQDVWFYVAGDFGGGSWTIERDPANVTNGERDDQVDINELQATIGFEWGQSNLIRAGRRAAFAEIGYVFDRELVYRSGTSQSLEDGFLFRVGIGY